MTDYSQYQHLLFERQEPGILCLTLNRPEVYNTTNARLHWELSRVWRDVGLGHLCNYYSLKLLTLHVCCPRKLR